jgi:hypothetical protein
VGSPRDYQGRYQDAMAVVREFGKPDLFITMTCNPHWAEITDLLAPNQKAYDRPDIVARVFREKLLEVKKDIIDNEIFGKVIAYILVIEFQKRGLPHSHMLFILDDKSKLRLPSNYDKIVSAEIPILNANKPQKRLLKTIKSCMVHGPCGKLNPKSPCMINGKCSKGYPKQFCNETIIESNGYPKYRRRENGQTLTINKYEIDNRWIVPYNPYLSLNYNCHINVEICSTITAIKYLYKYIYKGHDRTNIGLDKNLVDEVKNFQEARWVGPVEAMWRIYSFPLCEMKPSVQRLGIHLEREEIIQFDGNSNIETLINNNKDTHIKAYFKLNEKDAEAKNLLYHEIPKHYCWDKKFTKWKRRIQKYRFQTIGRIYFVSPQDKELWFLRLLLIHVKGKTSFNDLKTYRGTTYSTFREVCYQRGFLRNDDEYINCLKDSILTDMPSNIIKLFVRILLNCEVGDPYKLWECGKIAMGEGYKKKLNFSKYNLIIEQKVLQDINNLLEQNNKSLANDFPCLPQIQNESLELLEHR